MTKELPWLERMKVVATSRYGSPVREYAISITPPQANAEPEISIRIGRRWIWIMSNGCGLLVALITVVGLAYLMEAYLP